MMQQQQMAMAGHQGIWGGHQYPQMMMPHGAMQSQPGSEYMGMQPS
jgi:endonuclease YncB( thermonuclease family)